MFVSKHPKPMGGHGSILAKWTPTGFEPVIHRLNLTS